MPQPATDPGVYLFCEGIGCSCPTGFDTRHDRYQTDNRLRIVRKSEWKSVTSFVHSAEVRNNSCGYHLSNSSTVFTENAVNMDLSSSPASDSENTCRFFKHFCFCAPCSTVGAVPLLKLSRNRQSANVKVLYFVGSDQKCGTKFPACYAYWWQNKKKKQFFLVSRQVLSFKKNHLRLRTDSILQCVFLRFSTCCLHVYSRLTTTTQWGDTILSLSESCLLSNPVGKTTKTSSSKQVIFQMHSICFLLRI